MKTQNVVSCILLLFLFQLAACERDNVTISTEEPISKLKKITISGSTTINQGDAISFRLNNDLEVSKFKWKVSPDTGVLVAKNGSLASIYFPGSGPYTVTVMDSIKLDSVTTDVNVTVGGKYPNEVVSQQSFKSDDLMKLTPVIYKDSAFVILEAETKNTYPCSDNYLASTLSSTGESFLLDLLGVNFSTGCKSESSKSRREFLLVIREDKTYTIEINFNNKIYKGTVTKSGKDYKFTWPYTADVIMETPILKSRL
jgi:hypothetical protein